MKWEAFLWSNEPFETLFGKYEGSALWTTEERDHQACYQFKHLHL